MVLSHTCLQLKQLPAAAAPAAGWQQQGRAGRLLTVWLEMLRLAPTAQVRCHQHSTDTHVWGAHLSCVPALTASVVKRTAPALAIKAAVRLPGLQKVAEVAVADAGNSSAPAEGVQ
jgi:hypothetical protein